MINLVTDLGLLSVGPLVSRTLRVFSVNESVTLLLPQIPQLLLISTEGRVSQVWPDISEPLSRGSEPELTPGLESMLIFNRVPVNVLFDDSID